MFPPNESNFDAENSCTNFASQEFDLHLMVVGILS